MSQVCIVPTPESEKRVRERIPLLFPPACLIMAVALCGVETRLAQEHFKSATWPTETNIYCAADICLAVMLIDTLIALRDPPVRYLRYS